MRKKRKLKNMKEFRKMFPLYPYKIYLSSVNDNNWHQAKLKSLEKIFLTVFQGNFIYCNVHSLYFP